MTLTCLDLDRWKELGESLTILKICYVRLAQGSATCGFLVPYTNTIYSIYIYIFKNCSESINAY